VGCEGKTRHRGSPNMRSGHFYLRNSSGSLHKIEPKGSFPDLVQSFRDRHSK
jgi:hypothetical protein